MSTVLERRYRRVLRLLPAGYRQRWEEDMVSAFMEGVYSSDPHADAVRSGRPSLAERLSVVALAVRVRLNGSYATPRGLVWHHMLYGLALMVLLYQALAATISVAFTVRTIIEVTADGQSIDQRPVIVQFFIWSDFLSLLWVAAFGCFVLGRLVATRVLVVLALAAMIGVTATTYVLVGTPAAAGIPFGVGDISRWGWLAVSVASVFLSPPHARASRRFWLGSYLVGALTLVPITQLPYTPSWQWVGIVSLTNAATAALIIAMAVALLKARPGRRRSPGWLLALAAFASSVGGVRLVMALARDPWPLGVPQPAFVATTLDVISISLAVPCAVVGLFALRRLPGVSQPLGPVIRDRG